MMTIYYANKCRGLIDDTTALKWIAAWQRALANDVAPVWNVCAILHYIGDSQTEQPGPTDGLINIVTHSTTDGTLGTHWAEGAQPLGEVAVQDCIDEKTEPSSCGFHETVEMTFDAPGTLCFQVGNEIWAAELADRVESTAADYKLDGVVLENWSLPAAFRMGSAGPWDFRGVLTSNVVAPTGYQLLVSLGSGQWTQVTGPLARRSKRIAGDASRRAARMRRAGTDPKALALALVAA